MIKVKRTMLRDEKGQGSLEYILLIAGVLVLAVLVFVIAQSNFFKQGAKSSNETTSEITNALKNAREN